MVHPDATLSRKLLFVSCLLLDKLAMVFTFVYVLPVSMFKQLCELGKEALDDILKYQYANKLYHSINKLVFVNFGFN